MSRTRLPPASGTATWLDPAPNGNPRLEIIVRDSKGEEVAHIYEVQINAEGGGVLLLRTDFKTGALVRYRVKCLRRGVWECDCPDAQNRPERRCNCKHARALPRALSSIPF